MEFTIFRYDEIDSTNSAALEQARLGAAEGLCVVAKRQTAGRGRRGRVWVSEKDAGIYFSVVLRPKIELRFVPLVTLMAAVAVHDTLEGLFNLDCDIKWVNDIHVAGRKISGILAETCESTAGLAVVVGIGINVKNSNFPPEVSATATSVEHETGTAPKVEEILQKLTAELSDKYALLSSDDGAEAIRDEWTRRSSYAVGKAVRVMLENETFSGTTCGIEANGALRVKLADGEVRIVHAGDVERLRADQKQ